MAVNVKTDIIYYKIPTDFELEFNLCGCCQMRLLTDSVTDEKSFLTALARDVSRSRVIIIIGDLSEEGGIMKSVANAVNIPLIPLDYESYNITDSKCKSIIKGAMPLTSHDGIFGGCVIECGPQTMIVLTNERSVQRPILKNLVQPYISDIGRAIATPAAPVNTAEPETTEEQAELQPISESKEQPLEEGKIIQSEEQKATAELQQIKEENSADIYDGSDESGTDKEEFVSLVEAAEIEETQNDNADNTEEPLLNAVTSNYLAEDFWFTGEEPKKNNREFFDPDKHAQKRSGKNIGKAVLIIAVILLLTIAGGIYYAYINNIDITQLIIGLINGILGK